MRRNIMVASLIPFAAVLVTQSLHGQPGNVSDFMRSKLRHSQQILEGLAVEDYGKIAAGAKEVTALSQAASWQVIETPDYQQRSHEFRNTTRALEDAARNRNLDGAALAYVDMTMKCVSCHRYVRGVRMASAGEEWPQLSQLAR